MKVIVINNEVFVEIAVEDVTTDIKFGCKNCGCTNDYINYYYDCQYDCVLCKHCFDKLNKDGISNNTPLKSLKRAVEFIEFMENEITDSNLKHIDSLINQEDDLRSHIISKFNDTFNARKAKLISIRQAINNKVIRSKEMNKLIHEDISYKGEYNDFVKHIIKSFKM